jgi:hypothetical protein
VILSLAAVVEHENSACRWPIRILSTVLVSVNDWVHARQASEWDIRGSRHV